MNWDDGRIFRLARFPKTTFAAIRTLGLCHSQDSAPFYQYSVDANQQVSCLITDRMAAKISLAPARFGVVVLLSTSPEPDTALPPAPGDGSFFLSAPLDDPLTHASDFAQGED